MRDSNFDDSGADIKEQVLLGQYSELDTVASWIDSLKRSDVKLEVHESEGDLERQLFDVVNKIGSFLPIQAGGTKAPLFEQLAYWRANQPLFEEAHQRKPQLVDLAGQVKSLVKISNAQEDALNALRRQKGFISYLPDLEQSVIERFDQEETALTEEIALQRTQVSGMKVELDLKQKPFDTIAAHIDCKLPTFVAGAALVKKGMDVSVAFRFPQHPWLIVRDRRNNSQPLELFVDYFPDAEYFQSSPHVYSIGEGIKFPDILDLRVEPIRKGLIRNQDSWPMPFNAHTLQLFDSWAK
ncbi:MAG: hypothetical protein AAB557_05095 [Patescibacteria group bacterium]